MKDVNFISGKTFKMYVLDHLTVLSCLLHQKHSKYEIDKVVLVESGYIILVVNIMHSTLHKWNN